MAKTMKIAEYDAYFKSVLADYEDTPITKYFESDIKNIMSLANSGLKAKNKKEREEIYNQITSTITNLSKKMDTCFNDVIANFKGRGGYSNFKGTFYTGSNNGDDLEETIVNASKIGLTKTEFKKKAEDFVNMMDNFEQYVNNSDLNKNLARVSKQDMKDNAKSLATVYRNSKKVEKFFNYRKTGSSVHSLLESDENLRSLAVPFRYYTILAGIKTGKIKNLTPEIINDLRWISKATEKNPILPKGCDPTAANIKDDPEAQAKMLEQLKNQHTEEEIKTKLINARTTFANSPQMAASKISELGTFKRGQVSWARIAKTAGIVLGVGIALTTLFTLPIASGFVGSGFFSLLAESMIQSQGINAIVALMAPGAVGVARMGMLRRSSNKCIRKFNNLNAKQKSQLLSEIKSLSNINNLELQQKKINEINQKYGNILGKRQREIKRNVKALQDSIRSMEKKTYSNVTRRPRTRRGNEEVETHSIDNRGVVLGFVDKLKNSLSNNPVLLGVTENVLTKVKGFKSPGKVAFATGTTIEEPVVTPHVETNVKPVATEEVNNTGEESIEDQLDMTINEVKEYINETNYGFDVKIGGEEYSIDIARKGQIKNIYEFDSKLTTALKKIRTILLNSKRSFSTTLDNSIDEAKRMSKKGIGNVIPRKGIAKVLPKGKRVNSGDDSVVITVNKKPDNKGR